MISLKFVVFSLDKISCLFIQNNIDRVIVLGGIIGASCANITTNIIINIIIIVIIIRSSILFLLLLPPAEVGKLGEVTMLTWKCLYIMASTTTSLRALLTMTAARNRINLRI